VAALVLRLAIQLALQVPESSGVAKLIANRRSFPPLQAHQKQGSFPPPALPGFIGTSDPLRRPDGAESFPIPFTGRDPATTPGLPY